MTLYILTYVLYNIPIYMSSIFTKHLKEVMNIDARAYLRDFTNLEQFLSAIVLYMLKVGSSNVFTFIKKYGRIVYKFYSKITFKGIRV